MEIIKENLDIIILTLLIMIAGTIFMADWWDRK